MVPWNSALGRFAYNWQSKWVGIISIKTERTQIHFLSDVLVAVPWVPDARFPVSVKRRSCLRPSAEHVSACGQRNEASRRTREETSGTQGIVAVASPRIAIDAAFFWLGTLFSISLRAAVVPRRNEKQMVMQNFGGLIRCIMGDLQKSEMSHVSTL